MKCILIKKTCTLTDASGLPHVLKKGELYLRNLEVHDSCRDTVNLDDYIPQLDVTEINKELNHIPPFTILIFRPGGIGDLIAISSICQYLKDCNIIIYTMPKYFPLFRWFSSLLFYKDIRNPLFESFSFQKRILYKKNYRRFNCDGLIEKGDRRNWFRLLYNHAGINNMPPQLYRPSLVTDPYDAGYNTMDSKLLRELANNNKNILVCNKANVMHRSIEFADIFNALFPFLKKGNQVCVHKNHLSPADSLFLINIPVAKSKFIKVIAPGTLDNFFEELYAAHLVISVDTSAIHFREGIKKPAIGLYNSFTVESRTRYYKYTRSYDIKSDCPAQPCFIHPNSQLEFCPECKKLQFAAPCFSSKTNKTLHSQLLNIFFFNKNLF